MERVRTFRFPGLQITNCIFRSKQVEICYIIDDSNVAHNEDELRQQLADHLRINWHLIKVTKLRAKPIYKETILKPGEATTLYPEGSGKIGAFVHVAGKGNHALMSGHGRSPGDVLLSPNGCPVGVVKVALHSPLTPTGVYSYSDYLDVALAKLDRQDGYIGHVFNEANGSLHLSQQPVKAVEGMNVRCFDSESSRGVIDSTVYIRYDEDLQTDWRLISVRNYQGDPIHKEGDSGILIVYDAPSEGRVNAVGMLVGVEELPLDDIDKTTRRTSLAVALTTNFKALQKADYCQDRAIKFVR